MAKYSFIFPGQGSQAVGMLQSYVPDCPQIEQTFAQASNILDYDVWRLCQNGPAEKLNETQITQPVLLTASIALWRAWQHNTRTKPDFFAGHSLGEYSALCAANAIEFSDALLLVKRRAELMQTAVPQGQGAMAAVLGLSDEQIIQACQAINGKGIVEAVNFNAPGQVVIAGAKDAVSACIEECKRLGAKRALPLPVSVPSHCQLMEEASSQFAEILNQTKIVKPEIPVVQNVGVSCYDHPDDIRAALQAQLYSPVPWVKIIEFMVEHGVTHMVECGPGKVLTSLNKRINKSIQNINLNTLADFTIAIA